MKTSTLDLFGKNYPTRPGGRMFEKCSNNDNIKSIILPSGRNKDNNFDSLRRPGLTAQPPSKIIYDFDIEQANAIIKYGTKVHIDDKQFQHTFKDENGVLVTKNLSELSFDVSKKLSELQEITKTSANQPLNEKMELLNEMINEIKGKFAILSVTDMKNISKIITAMGDKLENPENIGLPRYLTSGGFESELKNDESRMTLFLAVKLKKFNYIATKSNSNNTIADNDELQRYMLNNAGAIYDLHKLIVYKNVSWDSLKAIMSKPDGGGKIDGYEFDDHPNTNMNIATQTKKAQDAVQRGFKKEVAKAKAKLKNTTAEIKTTTSELKTAKLRLTELENKPRQKSDRARQNNIKLKTSEIATLTQFLADLETQRIQLDDQIANLGLQIN
jgi:hypothetical protein